MRYRKAVALLYVSCLCGCQGATETEGSVAVVEQSVQCGSTWDADPVAALTADQLVDSTFVAAHQSPVILLHIDDDMGTADLDMDGLPDVLDPGDLSGISVCSGTVISDDLVLMARHCVDPTYFAEDTPTWRSTGVAPTLAEWAHFLHVVFNYQKDASGNLLTTTEVPVIEYIDSGDPDFAIVRLESGVSSTWGKAILSYALPPVNDVIALIHHPLGRPKEVSTGHLYDQDEDLDTRYLSYKDLDTDFASSGSGLLSKNTGMLFGIHVSGGCDSADTNYANHGIGMNKLVASDVIKRVLASNAAVYGTSYVSINDRAMVYTSTFGYAMVAAGEVNLGVSAHTGSVFSSGITYLRGGTVTGNVIAGGSISQQAGTSVTGFTSAGQRVFVPGFGSWKGSYPSTLGTASNLSLEPGVSQSIVGGTFGDVSVKANARLTLAAGTYYMRSLTVESGGYLTFNATSSMILVHIRDNLTYRGTMTYSSGVSDNVGFFVHGTGATVSGPFWATLFAPNASIVVDYSSLYHYGGFYGASVTLHQENRVVYRPFKFWSAFRID